MLESDDYDASKDGFDGEGGLKPVTQPGFYGDVRDAIMGDERKTPTITVRPKN